MADEATVDRLAIEVVATDDEAIKKINGLASALESLKTVTANMGDMGKAFEGLKGISSELSASTESIKGISTAFESLKGIGTIDISLPENIGETIANLNDAVSGLQADKVENIVKLADSLTSLNEVKEISLPKELPEQLKELAETVSGIEASNGESVGKLADSLSKLSSVGGGEMKSFIREFARLPQVADSLASVDINGLTEQIKALSVAMAPLAEKMKDIGSGMSAFNGKLPKIDTKKLDTDKEKVKKKEKVGIDFDIKGIDAAKKAIETVQASINQIGTSISQSMNNPLVKGKSLWTEIGTLAKRVGDNVKNSNIAQALGKGVEGIKSKVAGIGDALKNAFGRLSGEGKLGDVFRTIAQPIAGLAGALKGALPIAAQAAVSALSAVSKAVGKLALQLGSNVLSAINKFASALKSGIGKGIRAVGNGVKGIGATMATRFVKPFTNAIKKFNEWKNALGRVAFYRAVREAIKRVTDGFKEGMGNLYEYSRMVGTEFAPAMNQLATSSLYLKNSLGAISAPLIQAVAPVVDALIDKFVALLNIIGKVFAVLTGKSVYTQAKKHVTEYGDAVSGATKATQSFLLGIDELNVIEESAGGGGGAGADFGDMFEEVEIGEEFDWARQMREAIEAGEWGEAGAILATKLNEVIENWDPQAWGMALGTRINQGLQFAIGFVDVFQFEPLGEKLGAAILGLMDGIGIDGFTNIGILLASGWNGVFDTLKGILNEWEPRVADMGASLAAIINGWVEGIHWEENAETLSRGIIFLGDLVRETFEKIEWDKIGEGVAKALNNIKWYEIITSVFGAIEAGIDGLKEAIDSFLDNWDWKDTATQIYNGINDSIKDIDAKGWGETLGNAIETAFDFVIEIVDGLDWEEIGTKIGEFVAGLDVNAIIEKGKKLAKTVIDGIIKAIKGFMGEVPEDVTAVIALAALTIGTNIPKAIMSTKVAAIAAIVIAIAEIGSKFGDELKTFFEGLAGKINEFIEKIDWKEVGNKLSDGISNAVEAMIAFMEKINWAQIGTAISNFLIGIDWVRLLTDLGRIIGDAIAGILITAVTALPGILEAGAEIVAGLISGIIGAVVGIGTTLYNGLVKPIIDAVKEFFGIHSPSTVFEEIGGFLIEGLKNGIMAPIQGIIDFFSGFVEDVKNLFSGGWTDVNTDANEKWENIGKDVDGKVKKMTEDTNLDIEGLKEKLSGHTTEISDDFSTKIEGIQTDSKEKWEGISKDTNDKVEEIKTNVFNGYEAVSTDTQGKLEGIRDDSAKKWFSISKETNDKIEDVKKNVSNGYEKVKTDVTTKMGQTSTESGKKWEEIRSTTKTKVDNVNTEVDTGFGKVKTTINSKLDDAKREANQKDWTDVGKNVVDGISSGIARNQGKLEKQMSSTMLAAKKAAERAAGIASPSKLFRDDVGWFIGLGIAAGIDDSEPEVVSSISDMTNAMEKEVGNLNISMNLDTGNMKNDIANSFEGIRDYTNNLGLDVGNGMADGIKNSENEVLNALSSLNDDMQNELSDLSYSVKGNASDFEFPKPEDAYANYKVSYKEQDERRNGEQDNNIDITDGMRNANQEVVTALYAVATQIVNAVNDIDMKPVVTIGKKDITRAVEETQRQRGANIMVGGVRS